MSSSAAIDDGGTVARTYFELFAMPKPVRIMGRSSSITNSFVNGVIPVVIPSESEVREALHTLRMLEQISCAYCGDTSTEWDHLRPLVEGQRPTGYISEIRNLVPACGKCNQSKGNKHWLTWMRSAARLSPTSRGIVDIEERIARLQEYESGGVPTKIDFETVAGADLWERHWEHHKRLLELMREADADAQQIRIRVREAYDAQRTVAG
ncbi:HNH endonuclease signature motif containing protein [Microbacterium sp. TPD7012]|uniref:HNH endonuclease n=1 Tax=Microbacterium sp. TPD7012 TaxID=2171975 RepID=UPI001A9C99B3|nr:HNH endonuclease signature motif containing protein [Microbacterium sp. TPD7012]